MTSKSRLPTFPENNGTVMENSLLNSSKCLAKKVPDSDLEAWKDCGYQGTEAKICVYLKGLSGKTKSKKALTPNSQI